MARDGSGVLGWDVGGVNTKAARFPARSHDPARLRAVSAPYELQRNPSALVPTLRRLAKELGATGAEPHAVTMTAELSQLFRTKREGVGFVLEGSGDGISRARDSTSTRWTAGSSRRRRLAGSRWRSRPPTGWPRPHWSAEFETDAILIDTGSTTTDIIPIESGRVVAIGRTDPGRLLSGELVYTGALRTPAEALAAALPLPDGLAGVSAEGFALIGDALLWLGRLAPRDYTAPTPDGRPATREFAGERLARLVCGDRDMLDAPAIDAIAMALAEAQIEKIAAA